MSISFFKDLTPIIPEAQGKNSLSLNQYDLDKNYDSEKISNTFKSVAKDQRPLLGAEAKQNKLREDRVKYFGPFSPRHSEFPVFSLPQHTH